MKLYLLEPEVAGEIGNNSVLTYDSGIIKEVVSLHYVFDVWLGDDLLAAHPCFIVTKELEASIRDSNLTGYKFEKVEISTSETFKELYPDKKTS